MVLVLDRMTKTSGIEPGRGSVNVSSIPSDVSRARLAIRFSTGPATSEKLLPSEVKCAGRCHLPALALVPISLDQVVDDEIRGRAKEHGFDKATVPNASSALIRISKRISPGIKLTGAYSFVILSE